MRRDVTVARREPSTRDYTGFQLSNFRMDPSLAAQWDAPGSPFLPTVGKGTQFLVGFTLVLFGLVLFGGFALSEFARGDIPRHHQSWLTQEPADRSLINVPFIGIPASLALAFGTVYMFCAVGVYV
ncbi:hypothetical protein TruAng_011166 [Truncatella angustata]|nr:hypothetical protein TruAng_011166 [Truncatella angustata]